MNVVDSSGWLEYFAGSVRARLFAPAIEAPDRLLVPVLVLYEVVKKIRRERSDSAALEAAAVLRSGRIIEIDIATALDAAQLDLPMADSLIYATARRSRATLWTQDEDFASLRGVRYFPKK
ncbi:MAG: type II toxin-antitoxin system VapC family toxin [Vicinamibacteria bacterium]|nr:type II toxin-antitoxin system VapC family toxin [Vicinamibacteria bacterium]